jgi:hypothetical protein
MDIYTITCQKYLQRHYSEGFALGSAYPLAALLIPELIPQNDHREDEGDPIGQVNRYIVTEQAIEEPHEGTKSKKGVHSQRYAGGIFGADGFYRLG